MSDFEAKMSEKPENKPTFCDMPMGVFDIVLSNLEYKTHLVLRKVSKNIRAIIDHRRPPLKSITLSIDNRRTAEISFNGTKNPKQLATSAIEDLKSAIQNPKIQLEKLKISVHLISSNYGKDEEKEMRKNCANKIEAVLTALPHRRTLDVKTLELHVNIQEEILAVLAHLTPGFLETIHLEFSKFPFFVSSNLSVNLATTRLAMAKVVKLEQWKLAKNLHMERFSVQFPVKNILHFESTKIRLPSISMEQLKVLRDAHLHQPNFVFLELESSRQIDFASLDEYLGMGIPQERPDYHNRYYPVPDSEDHVMHLFVNWNFVKMIRILKSAIPENDV